MAISQIKMNSRKIHAYFFQQIEQINESIVLPTLHVVLVCCGRRRFFNKGTVIHGNSSLNVELTHYRIPSEMHLTDTFAKTVCQE
jgi:hypothetical protein